MACVLHADQRGFLASIDAMAALFHTYENRATRINACVCMNMCLASGKFNLESTSDMTAYRICTVGAS